MLRAVLIQRTRSCSYCCREWRLFCSPLFPFFFFGACTFLYVYVCVYTYHAHARSTQSPYVLRVTNPPLSSVSRSGCTAPSGHRSTPRIIIQGRQPCQQQDLHSPASLGLEQDTSICSPLRKAKAKTRVCHSPSFLSPHPTSSP